MTEALHDVQFPNESRAYREARNALLLAERELRRQVERVAEQRRALPPGGAIAEDYVFADVRNSGRKPRLSELFAGKSTLVAYSFMYGPKMDEPCPMCSSMLDALNGQVPHITQRAGLAVIAKSLPERIAAFARERGWDQLPLFSSADNRYNVDYKGEDANGNQRPAMNVFVLRDGKVHHSWCSELMFVKADPGQDPRHIDMIWPLWNVLDLTPEGRDAWRPKLRE